MVTVAKKFRPQVPILPEPEPKPKRGLLFFIVLCSILAVLATWKGAEFLDLDENEKLQLSSSRQDQMQLSAYGTGVLGIAVVFIGTVPQDAIHQDEITFDAAKKELYTQVRLPYADLEQATEAEVLVLMARKYLQTLRDLAALEQVVDFDWEHLLQDVQNLFVAKGLTI